MQYVILIITIKIILKLNSKIFSSNHLYHFIKLRKKDLFYFSIEEKQFNKIRDNIGPSVC